jgi:hypothetical protein
MDQIQESKSGLEEVVREHPQTEEFVKKVLEWRLSKEDGRNRYLVQMFDTCFDSNGVDFIESFRSFVVNCFLGDCFLDDCACEIDWEENNLFEGISLPVVIRTSYGTATLDQIISAMDQKVASEEELHQRRLAMEELRERTRKGIEELNMMPRRVETGGIISWYVNNKLVLEVTGDEYYRGGAIHPDDCQCDALVHDESFQARLRELKGAYHPADESFKFASVQDREVLP